jgi:acyl-CoA thioester hydrolase
MGIVHHSNFVRWLELARVRWMEEHHRSYRDYLARDLHFAVTRVEVDYKTPLAFDEEVSISVWLAWIGGASLRMEYALHGPHGVAAIAATEHAMVDGRGHVRRIPREERAQMEPIAVTQRRRPGAREEA